MIIQTTNAHSAYVKGARTFSVSCDKVDVVPGRGITKYVLSYISGRVNAVIFSRSSLVGNWTGGQLWHTLLHDCTKTWLIKHILTLPKMALWNAQKTIIWGYWICGDFHFSWTLKSLTYRHINQSILQILHCGCEAKIIHDVSQCLIGSLFFKRCSLRSHLLTGCTKSDALDLCVKLRFAISPSENWVYYNIN